MILLQIIILLVGEFLYPQIIQKNHLKNLETNYDNILKNLEKI